MLKKTILPLFFMFSCTHLSTPKDIQRDVAGGGKMSSLWVETDTSKSSAIRSNPQHFWAWMQKNSSNYFAAELLTTGMVTGDPHFFNFADIHTDTNRNGLALVDIDDSGRAPLILDFVRYSLFVEIYTKEDYLNELFSAYKKGLLKEEKSAPEILKNAIKHSVAELYEEHKTWLEKNTETDYKLKNKKNELTGFSYLDADLKSLGNTVKSELIKSRKLDKIIDAGHTVHDTGSSKDMNRFWFSGAKNNKLWIIECKELSKPAVASYTAQKEDSERISEVFKYYSDYVDNSRYFLKADNKNFWCRPRHYQFLTREDIKLLSSAQQKELALYFAYWLGLKQSYLPSGTAYAKKIQSSEAILESVAKAIKDYKKIVNQLRQ